MRHSKRLRTVINKRTIKQYTVISYVNAVSSPSKCCVVLCSSFLWWCGMIKCPRDEMNWGEGHRLSDVALGYYWPSDHLTRRSICFRTMVDCNWNCRKWNCGQGGTTVFQESGSRGILERGELLQQRRCKRKLRGNSCVGDREGSQVEEDVSKKSKMELTEQLLGMTLWKIILGGILQSCRKLLEDLAGVSKKTSIIENRRQLLTPRKIESFLRKKVKS